MLVNTFADLTVVDGPNVGMSATARLRTPLTVGRGDHAGLRLSFDLEIEDAHFRVEIEHSAVVVRDLDSMTGTFVNEQRVLEGQVTTGDRIAAGRSVFNVLIRHEKINTGVPDPQPAVRQNAHAILTDRELISCLEPEEIAAARSRTPAEFVHWLIDVEAESAALFVVAGLLERSDAVSWAIRSVRRLAGDSLAAVEIEAIDTAEKWVIERAEIDRRRAGDLAELLEYNTSSAFVAVAAFWAEGSIGPPDSPDIVPLPHLMPRAVATAVELASIAGNANEGHTHRIECILDTGLIAIDANTECETPA